MDNRDRIKAEFKYYLANVARSARRTSDGFNLGRTAVDSFLSFIEADRLFDYAPEKWGHIKSMYDITIPDEVKQIADNLLNDKAFLEHDNAKNQGWRSGAISHYVCFINARSFFLGNQNTEKHFYTTDKPLQQIYYGAPGTGKSHEIKKLTKGKEVIRTTFHPDSDYSTFVGAYKPTTKRVPIYSTYGEKAVEVKDTDGNPMTEDRIVYEFVEQAFLQAYIKAWKQYAKADEGKAAEEVYLVIEEINRGNCAQIFGDLFQLLDRGEDGFSEYPIVADKDLQKQLAKAFADMPFLNAPSVCGMSAEEVAVKIRKGEILLLPNNLYIWATMNTSDQSLFPIDSAFKRRWDWQYMPIANGNKGWRISANGNEYDWWEFLEKINTLIGEKTSSEDKKLGYYFCKAKDGVIDAKMFVGKVIFYLWNDVFKDYEFEGDAFNDVEGKLTFDKFYKTVDGTTSVVAEKVMLFLKNLEVVPVVENEDEDIENVDDPDSAEGKDYTRYTINGEGNYPKRQLSTQAVRKYIELHPELTPEQVVADWMSLGSIVSHFVETKEQFDARTDNSKRSHEVPCGDTKIYVAWNGWGIGSKMQTLITAVNSKDWGITLAIKE